MVCQSDPPSYAKYRKLHKKQAKKKICGGKCAQKNRIFSLAKYYRERDEACLEQKENIGEICRNSSRVKFHE